MTRKVEFEYFLGNAVTLYCEATYVPASPYSRDEPPHGPEIEDMEVLAKNEAGEMVPFAIEDILVRRYDPSRSFVSASRTIPLSEILEEAVFNQVDMEERA